MTSEEIKQADPLLLSVNGWLKEIAYQLALLNEKPQPKPADDPRKQPIYRR
jgi:hypothetical protein